MRLLEVEMDLPYQMNKEFVFRQQQDEEIDYQNAVKIDYEENWKGKRREFQLMTRCITSMVERIMKPIETKDCWKILIECVENVENTNYRNLLGVYAIQVKMNLEVFYLADDYKKKEIMVDTILKGIKQLSQSSSFNLNSIIDACMKIINDNYVNEWIWKRIKINNKILDIRVEHEIRELNIMMVISLKNGIVEKKEKVINTIPDERIYSKYLGKLLRISEKVVALLDKSGNEVMRFEV